MIYPKQGYMIVMEKDKKLKILNTYDNYDDVRRVAGDLFSLHKKSKIYISMNTGKSTHLYLCQKRKKPGYYKDDIITKQIR